MVFTQKIDSEVDNTPCSSVFFALHYGRTFFWFRRFTQQTLAAKTNIIMVRRDTNVKNMLTKSNAHLRNTHIQMIVRLLMFLAFLKFVWTENKYVCQKNLSLKIKSTPMPKLFYCTYPTRGVDSILNPEGSG